jgi:hypothetical protein
MPHPSISEYYHNPGGWIRDVLVGALSAVAFFFYFYKGYSKAEDIVLNLAGISAAIVALAPMRWSAGSGSPRLFPEGPVSLHGISAALLFLFIAYISIFRSGETLKLLRDPKGKSRYQLQYRILGWLMVAVPTAIFLIDLLSPKAERSVVVFAIETAGIVLFAAYWLTKSREVAHIQNQG